MGSELQMIDSQAVRISIIVACRNEIDHIRGLLDSILSQDMAGMGWEAIIADGMSDDGTREVLEEYNARHVQLRFIANPGRIVPTGLNAAIRMARGEIILRMDAHTSYAPNYCRLCVETLDRTGADNVGGPVRTRALGVRAEAVAAAYHSPFSSGGARFHNENYEGCVDTLAYGCWRKTTLERIGLFDETLVRNQDDELNLRLVRAGGKIWQNPAIVSWYSPRPTLSNLFRQYFQYGFWRVAVIRKHRLPGSWRQVVPIGFILANILLLTVMVATWAAGTAKWFTVSSVLWLTMIAAYVLVTLAASFVTASRNRWATLPYLPAVFATYHLSYGLGFLIGLRWCFSKPTPTSYFPSVSTQITR
jgi:succinoglycan biosynthesis protein ExoA